MKRFHRSDRLSEEIMREVSSIIHNDIKDPRLGSFVSVTRVELSRDLRHGKVFVSVFGPDKEKEGTMAALGRGAGFVRSLIGKRMRLRSAPELVFHLDNSIEQSAHIGNLLREVIPPEPESPDEDDEGDGDGDGDGDGEPDN